ncbi:MAG: nuclear transport factor 2 family protein [Burkholderiaceae bacterium]|nr:nuclear transport factor 2 family protein [Burkholderiaceae bacterium]
MIDQITHEMVRRWEQRRCEAMLAGDVLTLKDLLSEQAVYVHSTSVRDSRASYLQKISSGALRYLQLFFSDLDIQISDGVVLVAGCMAATVLKDGQQKAVRSTFLTVWLPESGGWRLRAHQGTPQP